MVLKLLAVLNGKIGYLFSRKKNNDITPDLLQCFYAFQVAKKNVPCLLHLDLLVADPPNLSVSLSELRPKIVGITCIIHTNLRVSSSQMIVFGILHSVHSRKISIAAKPDLIIAACES